MLCAAAITVGLHLVSFHTDTGAHFNNTNLGVYIASENYAIGTYYNSVRKQSVYAVRTLESESCRFDFSVGVVTGYSAPVLPFAVASVKFDTSQIVDRSRVRFTLMPVVNENKAFDGVALHLSVEKDF